jgi:hypothetical protein
VICLRRRGRLAEAPNKDAPVNASAPDSHLSCPLTWSALVGPEFNVQDVWIPDGARRPQHDVRAADDCFDICYELRAIVDFCIMPVTVVACETPTLFDPSPFSRGDGFSLSVILFPVTYRLHYLAQAQIFVRILFELTCRFLGRWFYFATLQPCFLLLDKPYNLRQPIKSS